VQRFVTLLPIEMHNILKDWIESIEIQRYLMLSLDPCSISRALCLFIASIVFYNFTGERSVGDWTHWSYKV